jgi:gliding motility-associated-like protein
VIIADRYGCIVSYVADVVDPEPFVITASEDAVIHIGHSIALDASGNYVIDSIMWSPEAGLSCTYCPSTIATPLSPLTYVVTAVSEFGCTARDSVQVTIDDDPRMYIPNIFSPNGDGINDVWGIAIDQLSASKIERLVIFDRWGNILRTASGIPTANADELWDGKNNTTPVGSGVYVYLLQLVLADGRVIARSGNVTVLR